MDLTREKALRVLHSEVCNGYYASEDNGMKHNFRHGPYPPCERIADQLLSEDDHPHALRGCNWPGCTRPDWTFTT